MTMKAWRGGALWPTTSAATGHVWRCVSINGSGPYRRGMTKLSRKSSAVCTSSPTFAAWYTYLSALGWEVTFPSLRLPPRTLVS
ncbi:hypothetical protein C8J56DRAFT_974634 [Mycena floridula]|nr:hypothetical protein C8J56DRAFT_974634 [Mycena floridula]